MVRGRRVRAMVACARNEDCCSPHPKRRDQKIALNGKLLEPNKTITAFFHTVDVDILDSNKPVNGGLNGVKPLTLRSTRKKQQLLINFSYKELEDTDEDVEPEIKVPTTPVIVNKTKAFLNESTPPTPHRIELCADEAPKEVPVEAPVEMPALKGRRRLNNNQVISKQDSKNIGKNNLNHKLTEYFPVRRSVRKTKKTVLEEKQRSLEQLLRSEIEEGLAVKYFGGKGRGVVAVRPFCKGDFVVEYSGDLIDITEAKRRELKYAQDQNTGCYMYYFKHNDQQYCVDATAETGKLGRLVNHSRNGNLLTRTMSVDGKPRLVLIAKDDIKEGEEITYDYGDRSKESLVHHPWLAY